MSISNTLQSIISQLENTLPTNPGQMTGILRRGQLTQEELMDWADLDHPKEDSYGRKLVHQGENFEVMVMSWAPGDFSGIHDHGFTQWGAVQIFGNAEHAIFKSEDGKMSTLARWITKTGDVVGVSHELIHQMGNPGDEPFLSLHVYGTLDKKTNITGEARLYVPDEASIQRINGGVFFALPENEILRTENGPVGDLPVQLRHQVEFTNRLITIYGADSQEVKSQSSKVFSKSKQQELLVYLDEVVNYSNGKIKDSMHWDILNMEFKAAARLQERLNSERDDSDHFHKYAELYDELIGKVSMDDFMKNYLEHVQETTEVDFSTQSIISLGCGTGLVEQWIIDHFDASKENILGIDFSEAMVSEAKERINAEVGDILNLNVEEGSWDVAYSGLNVFQYLPESKFEQAIENAAALLKPGGYFVGDFIAPDHISWYPNVMYSGDKRIISLRTPQLIEEYNDQFQESEIINISFMGEAMEINYAGKHRRYLPPLHLVRILFAKHFGGEVQLMDARELTPLSERDESSASTRYVVIARKAEIDEEDESEA